MKLSDRSIYRLLFSTPMGSRFTQDSPILPDVWRAFARNPNRQYDLILSPKYGVPAGKVANYVLHALNNDDSADIAYLPGRVVAKLTFIETLQIVLPNTRWWRKTFGAIEDSEFTATKSGVVDSNPRLLLAWIKHKDAEIKLGELLYQYWKKGQLGGISGAQLDQAGRRRGQSGKRANRVPSSFTPDGLWFIRMVGTLACLSSESTKNTIINNRINQFIKDSEWPLPATFQALIDDYLTSYRDEDRLDSEAHDEIGKFVSLMIAQEFLALFSDVERVVADVDIWSVNRNRDAASCIKKSILGVKGDAARLLFEIDCSKITWAVVDGGINARHPAFLEPPKSHSGTLTQTSRVRETLDFRGIRTFLDPKILSKLSAITLTSIPDVRVKDDPVLHILGCLFNRQKGFLDPNNENSDWFDIAKSDIEKRLSELNTRLRKGFEIDWADLEFLIRDPSPLPPINDHGTHVAGILAADWNEYEVDKGVITSSKSVMKGMCPNISVMDVRVLRDDGRSDEFEVMAALQYIRYRNQRSGFKEIHGVNLSLSIHHEIRNFACGRTPICDECSKAVADGIVVVSAAGNEGYIDDADSEGGSIRYRASSITDPGNTEDVITVGATHRSRPHQYGVSYFSSRGPTGDGRIKPDIVAPGEKINAPVGQDDHDYKDGTSMAAPHVSGAAALLMARHKELIGNPQRIKEILCNTATDLGRERYFQGHGMLDILRALQSV